MNEVKIPKHVAIIMDGNGRWAQNRGLKRSMGHKEGAKNLKELCPFILKQGVEILSIFAFSTENFKRSKEEVDFLMNLFVSLFEKEIEFIEDNNIKVVFSGVDENLPKKIIKIRKELVEKTKDNDGGILNVCLNYGGQLEILDTIKKISKEYKENKLDIEQLTTEDINKYLYNDLPQIDFLIRTSGENRVSNFMLWQLAYAEFYFPEKHFPEFSGEDFIEALRVYTSRDRRFGGVKNENKNN
ncbi:MAG: polyprenyl diphosphate synthase [Mycoplasmatota bacterium]